MSEPRSVVQWNVSFAGIVLAVAVVVGAIIYAAFFHASVPERPTPELNFWEAYLVDEAAQALAETIKENPIKGIETVAFIPIRDPENKTGLAVDAFHQILRDLGPYHGIERRHVDAAIAKLLPFPIKPHTKQFALFAIL